MFSRNKSKSRLVIRSSPEIRDDRSSKSRKKKHSLAHEFDILFSKINSIREWTRHLIRDSVDLVSTESDMDIKSYLDDSEKKHLGKTKLENLGMNMINAAKKSSGIKGGMYEKALLKVGECERRLGTYGRDFVVDVCSSFIRPLQYFMDVELNKLLEEKEMLTSRKIDYDYHVRQASNGRADKNTHHKLKMAEMALEFQYIHAKEILQAIEVSECQVGHLSDLVNVQSMYHQKCLDDLEKLKSEIKRMSSSTSTEKNNLNSVNDNSMRMSSLKSKKRVVEANRPELRPSCTKKLENHSTTEDTKFQAPNSRMSQEHFQNATRKIPEKSLMESAEVYSQEAQGGKSIPGESKIRLDLNKGSGLQHGKAHEVKSPQKARSSILPSIETNRARLGKLPGDSRARQNVEPSQECSKNQSKVYSIVKPVHEPSVNLDCHHYSGDHSGEGNVNKEDYTSDDSTTSKETHVIPIPIRSNYRRDVGKMFFTPCKDLE